MLRRTRDLSIGKVFHLTFTLKICGDIKKWRGHGSHFEKFEVACRISPRAHATHAFSTPPITSDELGVKCWRLQFVQARLLPGLMLFTGQLTHSILGRSSCLPAEI